ncbi:MAG: arginine N-succinyltransferase [Phycisphaerae bacterium]|nr:arginine N-succinyltransferase [Phycisphaerae bacterium]
MFFLRETNPADLDTLYKLARMVHFINLPADKELIGEKIARSRACFLAAATGEEVRFDTSHDGSAVKGSPIYMFSIVDSETQTCHGTAMIIARMGYPGNPNLSFEVSTKHFFSKDLGQGTSHLVLKLHLDETSPTEIGGLILAPSMRKHPERLGKQLSLIRFHFMGMNPHLFSDRVIAEMIPPMSADGRSVFWDALGRRFINLSYAEADLFCQHSREFMVSLLPREEIYATLLPPEARQVIGQVGPDTKPARKMLEDIGFRFKDRVDPFDGGPHIEAKLDDITLVKSTQPDLFAGPCPASQCKRHGFVSVLHEDGKFRAVHTPYTALESGSRAIKLPKEAMQTLMLEAGMPIGVTPLNLHGKSVAKQPKRAKSSKKRATRATA